MMLLLLQPVVAPLQIVNLDKLLQFFLGFCFCLESEILWMPLSSITARLLNAIVLLAYKLWAVIVFFFVAAQKAFGLPLRNFNKNI